VGGASDTWSNNDNWSPATPEQATTEQGVEVQVCPANDGDDVDVIVQRHVTTPAPVRVCGGGEVVVHAGGNLCIGINCPPTPPSPPATPPTPPVPPPVTPPAPPVQPPHPSPPPLVVSWVGGAEANTWSIAANWSPQPPNQGAEVEVCPASGEVDVLVQQYVMTTAPLTLCSGGEVVLQRGGSLCIGQPRHSTLAPRTLPPPPLPSPSITISPPCCRPLLPLAVTTAASRTAGAAGTAASIAAGAPGDAAAVPGRAASDAAAVVPAAPSAHRVLGGRRRGNLVKQ